MVALVLFLRVWQPKKVWTSVSLKGHEIDSGEAKAALPITRHSRADLIRAWTPWAILTLFVFVWGLPVVKTALNGIFAPSFPIDGLNNLIEKVPPVVPKPTKEGAVYVLGLLSATGTGILLAAIVGGLVMKYNPVQLLSTYARTVWLVRYSLLTIVLMLALGTLTRYSGTDTTLGLAFADILLRQRVAVNMQNRSTRTSIVGVDVAMPVALAPTGLTGMQHADGEILAARAAKKFGVPFTLSTMSICSIEDVAAHIKSPFWFQVYVMKDRDFIEPLIDRAKSANCGALMMTLDLQMLGQRHKDIRRPVGAAHASRRSGRDVRRIR